MKKRILAILLAMTMLLSENSVVLAAEETFHAPAQADVLDEMEDPEAASIDAAETEDLPEEGFTEPRLSGEEISWSDLDPVAGDPEEPAISTDGMDEMTDPMTEPANAAETEDPQTTEITEPQAAADPEDITNEFKDPNFRAALRDYLEQHEGSGENGPITKTACKEIVNLDVSNKGIKDLAGIEYLTNLISLDCSNNKLEQLPLDNCPALQTLSCFGNELTSLDVNDCPELKLLMCHANKITSLDITDCPALDSLNCAFNQLTRLNMKCASLTLLECTDNRLTSLNISGYPKLKTLSCSHNQLSGLDVGGCPDLEQIFCRNNRLTKLDVSKCPKLIYIDCRENYMKSKANVTGRNSQLKENYFLFDPQKGAAAQTFTVTFDKNAAKASLAANKRTKKVTQGKTYGALPTPSWSGYYFLGWYTAKSGGKKVTSGTKVSLKKNQTLYAHWVKADLTAAKISVKNCTWNGKSQKPSVTVTWRGMTLKYNKDYTLTYSNNKNPGKGKVTVKGKGVFSGSKNKTASFTISKAAQTITAKNIFYRASYKGKSIALKVSVKGGAKLTYASNKNDQIRVLNKNSSKLKLISPGAATITIRAAETKYYRAATKKVTVTLQGAQIN